ncbi:PIR protein [Plasmodium vivax]|uniref:VIR protein n=1 Tax=Plasmodium vivax TaxID=5855 RepID=A0A565A3L0_PLAVI|nr:PIR protein [Plasmodium vivax]
MRPEASKNNYEFFQNMDQSSMYKAVKSVSNGALIESSSVKSFSNCDSDDITDLAKPVCKKFNNLINLLYSNRPNKRIVNYLNINEYKYLSYWLLQEFNTNKVKFSNISENFYNNNKKTYNNFFSMESLKSAVEIIQPMNFEDMNILDNLYKNYSEIYAIISSGTENVKESCSQYIEQCNNYFELGNNKCSDNSSDFCKAIHSFKESYENSFKLYGIEDIWDSFKLKESQSKDKISEQKSTELITENEKSNMFTPILAPIIGLVGTSIISYKFTPLGPWLRNTVNKKKEIKNTINRETHGLLNGDENNNININSGPYNVRYHS